MVLLDCDKKLRVLFAAIDAVALVIDMYILAPASPAEEERQKIIVYFG